MDESQRLLNQMNKHKHDFENMTNELVNDNIDNDMIDVLSELLEYCSEPGILLTDIRQRITELIEELN